MQENSRKDLFSRFAGLSMVTLLSRILGLAREITKAYFLGVGLQNDAFNIAFMIPNLFRRLTAEGATLNALIPSFAEAEKEGQDALRNFFAGFFLLYTLLLAVFCTIFILFAEPITEFFFSPGFSPSKIELTAELTVIMFFYLLFISLAALCQGILNYRNSFFISACSPIVLNLTLIFCAWAFSFVFENKAYGFSIGVLIGGFLQLAIQIPAVKKEGFSFLGFAHLRHSQILKTFGYILPGVFGAGIYQINLLVGNIIAASLEDGSISALNFSTRLQEFALGVFVISITTLLLPRLSKWHRNKDSESFEKGISDACLLNGYLTIPAAIVLALLAEQIVRLLFGYGAFDEKAVHMTSQALIGHSIGLIFIGYNRIFVTAFQSAKYFRLSVYIAFASMIFNLISAFFWSRAVGHEGIAYANSAAQIFQALIGIFLLKKIFGIWLVRRWFLQKMLKHCLAAGVVCIFLVGVSSQKYLTELSSPVQTFLLLTGAATLFLGASLLLKIEEIKILLSLFLKKK